MYVVYRSLGYGCASTYNLTGFIRATYSPDSAESEDVWNERCPGESSPREDSFPHASLVVA